MKKFTSQDLNLRGELPRLIVNRQELVDSPLGFHKLGLQQTASGYGSKLTSRYKIDYNGKLHRVYASCFGNAASHWFVSAGQKIFIL